MTFTGQLRPFQVEAFDRMVERKRVLVGYEMGLGKTVLSIATIEHLLDEGLVSQGLVVVPSSLKYQWMRQIDAFTDEAIALVVDGTPTQRREQYAEIRDGGVEYAILNYEQVVNDWDEVKTLPRDFVVLDEATAIKNFAAKRSKRIKKLGSKYRYALSGQPIENKPEEVFSIMQWVDEDVLGRFDKFDKTFIVRNHFGGVKYYRALPLLHETLGGAMVRKTRQDPDVRDQMPDVTEEIVEIDFDRAGASLYRTIASDLQKEMAAAIGTFGKGFDLAAHYSGEASAEELQQRGKIMSRLTCLRMLCDHPDLLTVSATKYTASQAGEGMAGGSAYAQELLAAGLLDKPMKSPKMKATVDLVEELLEANPRNKVVLFAFFKDVLTMLQDATAGMAKSVLFTGDMSPKEKDTAKQTFQDDPECVTGETRVESVGDLLAVTRALYHGEVVIATTASGVGLSVTANHPVLTRRGWVAASDLHPGDEVFRQNRRDWGVTAHDLQDAPLTAEQLFDAALAAGAGTLRSTEPGDFHGDAGAFQGEVDVVVVDGPLRDHLFGKKWGNQAKEVLLSGAARRPFTGQVLDSLSPLQFRGVADSPSARSGPDVGHVGGVTSPWADLDAALGQQALDLAEPGGVLRHEVGDGGAFEVISDEILSVDSAVSTLHVYNLHTESGVFLADSLVVHNCRLFLSSDAGGYGVDLPNANYLISLDLPWSAGKMDQRNARIIRLSSEFDKVTLIYMLMHGSIEEWQYEKVVQKQAIGAAIMDGKGFDKKTGRLELNLKGLSEFLATSEV